MGIHVTPIPRLTTLTTPAFTLGTASAAGDALTAVASNSTLLAFDTVAVDAITLGQSGSVGTATTAPRRDHAHAMESLTAASQAEMEAATSNTVFATPGRTQNHPGVAKAWADIDGDTSTAVLDASYNCASVTDNGTGDYTVTITTDFSSADYAAVTSIEHSSAGRFAMIGTKAAGSVQVEYYAQDGTTHVDGQIDVVCYGDQ